MVTWLPSSCASFCYSAKNVDFSSIFQEFPFRNVELICFLQRSVFSTWILFEKNMFCWKHVNPPQFFQTSFLCPQDFFAAFCFTICVASGYDLSWTIARSIVPQTPPLTQHHENLAARHSHALYTNHLISFSYFLISLYLPNKATDLPKISNLRKVFHKTLREHRVFWKPPWSNDIQEHWDYWVPWMRFQGLSRWTIGGTRINQTLKKDGGGLIRHKKR